MILKILEQSPNADNGVLKDQFGINRKKCYQAYQINYVYDITFLNNGNSSICRISYIETTNLRILNNSCNEYFGI